MKKIKLPPDPEGMNDKRSAWAVIALVAFMKATRTDKEDAVSDLLADMGHYCDRAGLDLSAELQRAEMHYREETGGKGKQFTALNVTARNMKR